MAPRSKTIIILIVLLVLGVVYFIYDPSTSSLFPRCPVYALTGYPCAGCGSQRAIHALLHLDFAEAIRYNFLMVVSIPCIFVLLIASLLRTRFPKFYIRTHSSYVAITYGVIIILWWILRSVFGWYV